MQLSAECGSWRRYLAAFAAKASVTVIYSDVGEPTE
jgi:hypothetical protein